MSDCKVGIAEYKRLRTTALEKKLKLIEKLSFHVKMVLLCCALSYTSKLNHEFLHYFFVAATSNKFRIVLNTSRTKYDDAAMHCLQRNSTLVDSSNNMKEILQLLIFAQNIDNPGPVNVTIWLKENTTSNVQSSPSILRLEYQYGENNISVGNEEYLNISTDTTNAQPNDLHSFACKEGWYRKSSYFFFYCYNFQV